MKATQTIVLFAVLLVASVVLTGCNTAEPAAEIPTGGDVAQSGAQAEQAAEAAIDDQLVAEDDTVEIGELI